MQHREVPPSSSVTPRVVRPTPEWSPTAGTTPVERAKQIIREQRALYAQVARLQQEQNRLYYHELSAEERRTIDRIEDFAGLPRKSHGAL